MSTLRKSNLIESVGSNVLKRSEAHGGVELERRALAFLTSPAVRSLGFHVADLVSYDETGSEIQTRRIDGLRAHEYLLSLHKLATGGSSNVAYATLGAGILSGCAEQLSLFHSKTLQAGLRETLQGSLRRYPYFGRAMEAVDYLVRCSGRSETVVRRYRVLIDRLATSLIAAPTVLFRDAIPKNFILAGLPSLKGSGNPNLVSNDISEAVALRPDTLERLAVFNVDFQQVGEIVTLMDDWSQLAISEAAGFETVAMGWNWTARLAGISKENEFARRSEFYSASCLRCIRAMARRCFYHAELRVEYMQRYGAESAFHYSNRLRELSESIVQQYGVRGAADLVDIADMYDICLSR
jgi:hypothetical protein